MRKQLPTNSDIATGFRGIYFRRAAHSQISKQAELASRMVSRARKGGEECLHLRPEYSERNRNRKLIEERETIIPKIPETVAGERRKREREREREEGRGERGEGTEGDRERDTV